MESVDEKEKVQQLDETLDFNKSEWGNVHFSFGAVMNMHKVAESLDFSGCNKSSSTTATSFGGSISLDYRMWVSDSTWIAFRLGVDSGSKSNTKLNRNLQFEENAIRREVGKRDVFRQMLQGISKSFSLTYDIGVGVGGRPAVTANKRDAFVEVLRYIGGENIDISHNNFITDNVNRGAIYVGGAPNANANLRSFIGDNTAVRISDLGGGNFIEGLNQVREFVCRQYPGLALAFKHLAENQMTNMNNAPVLGGGGGVYRSPNNLNDDFTVNLDDFFGGRFRYVNNLNQLGIVAANMGGIGINELQNVINSIYFPTGADDNSLLQRTVIESKVKTKVHFGICPSATVIVGRYVPQFGGSFYVGAGAILLCGTLTPVDDPYDSKSEKFRKIAPQFVAGFEKRISRNWGFGFEISQTIKVSQKMSDSEFGRQRIKRSTEISRTTMKLMCLYNL